MKKILIATWVNYDNYGSLLQAFCLKEELSSIEKHRNRVEKSDVYLLNYLGHNKSKHNNLVYSFYRFWRSGIRKGLKSLLNRFLVKIYRKKISMRHNKFSEFRRARLNLYPEHGIDDSSLLKSLKMFDLYVAGSDQIWNPKLLDETYLLSWAPENATKISYASSVCVKHLTEFELEKYQVLSSFEALSVREYTGAVEQISDLVHKRIVEVVDPVLLYGRDKLRKMCKEITTKEYAAIYLLDGAKKKHDLYKNFLRDNDISVKVIPSLNPGNLLYEMLLCKKVEWDVGPAEFINLIYNSRVIITDSFHGVVVALLLHKDFIVLPREAGDSEQNNRLLSLLEKVGLKEQFGFIPEKITDIREINWKKVDKRIDEMRKRSVEYLRLNLK